MSEMLLFSMPSFLLYRLPVGEIAWIESEIYTDQRWRWTLDDVPLLPLLLSNRPRPSANKAQSCVRGREGKREMRERV